MDTVVLQDFLIQNQAEVIQRCVAKSANRGVANKNTLKVNHGISIFLQHVVNVLRMAGDLTRNNAEEELDALCTNSTLLSDAASHGAELLRQGYSIDQIVHEYGDVCQATTEMALEKKIAITVDDYRIFNRCLDAAIAESVSAFTQQGTHNKYARSLDKRLKFVAEEQLRLIDIAIRAHEAIRTGNIGVTGSTGALLIYALEQLRKLSDKDFAEIRLELENINQSNYLM